jgi:hypothetical protein
MRRFALIVVTVAVLATLFAPGLTQALPGQIGKTCYAISTGLPGHEDSCQSKVVYTNGFSWKVTGRAYIQICVYAYFISCVDNTQPGVGSAGIFIVNPASCPCVGTLFVQATGASVAIGTLKWS